MSSRQMPRDKPVAYQRWNLRSFADPVPEPTPVTEADSPSPPAVVLPTAEQVETIYQQARDEGYLTGHEQGNAEATRTAQTEYNTRMKIHGARLSELAEDYAQALGRLDREIAEELLSLALQISKQILRQALRVRPELLLAVVREAVATLPRQASNPQVLVSPEDLALVREAMGERLDQSGWRLIGDPTIAAGGCEVRHVGGQIDASLENRWQRLAAALGREDTWLEDAS